MLGYTPQIIAFTGKAGSGKTTAANWVLRNHSKAMKMSFAKPLKKMFYELLRESTPKGWPHSPKDYMDGDQKEQPIEFLQGMTARHLMQTLGTEWGRNTLHPDFWVNIAAGKVERLLGDSRSVTENPAIKVMFDDARFPNEAKMVQDFGGIIIRIERPSTITDETATAHASEQEQDTITPDYVIQNDGTLEEFEAKLAELLPPPPKKA